MTRGKELEERRRCNENEKKKEMAYGEEMKRRKRVK